MAITSVADYRFEYINSSDFPDVVKMRNALRANPPVVGPAARVCNLLKSGGAVRYFALDVRANLVHDCAAFKMPDIDYISISHTPMLMGAMVFSKRANALKLKVNQLVSLGFYATDQIRNERRMAAENRARPLESDADTDALETSDILQTLLLLGVGLSFAVITFTVECWNQLSLRRKRRLYVVRR